MPVSSAIHCAPSSKHPPNALPRKPPANLALNLHGRTRKPGATSFGSRTGSVFLNVFNMMYALPLDLTRLLRPRMSRGRHAERPREISVPWPEPWHVHDRSQVGNSPRTRFIRVREL